MHAVVIDVTIQDRQAAQETLTERIVPSVSSAPGFVAGYWLAISEDQGHSVVVFESEEAAKAAADQATATQDAPVTFDSVSVAEVVAHA